MILQCLGCKHSVTIYNGTPKEIIVCTIMNRSLSKDDKGNCIRFRRKNDDNKES